MSANNYPIQFDQNGVYSAYDEAQLSKFHVPATMDNRRAFIKRKEDRYFKLVVNQNMSKDRQYHDPDGYFSHLDEIIPKPEPIPYHNNSSHHHSKDIIQEEDSESSEGSSVSPPMMDKGSNGFDDIKTLRNNNSTKNVHQMKKGYVNRSGGGNNNNNNVNHNNNNNYYSPAPGSGLKRSADSEVAYLENSLGDSDGSPPSSHHHYSENESQPSKNINVNPDREDVFFMVIEHPLKHQVKEFNILPAGILQLMRHYQSSPSDYIVVKLLCDPKMEKDEIFLTAVSAHYSQSNTGEISIPSLKVSQKMLPGRTKGYAFRLLYELFVSGKIVQTEVTDEFFIWSNVNQKGYPRKERNAFINQRIESNRKKVKPKRKTPGRPRKTDNDEIEFDES